MVTHIYQLILKELKIFFLNKLNNVMTIAQNKITKNFIIFILKNKILSYDNKNKKKANYIDYGLSIFQEIFFLKQKNVFNLDLIFQN